MWNDSKYFGASDDIVSTIKGTNLIWVEGLK